MHLHKWILAITILVTSFGASLHAEEAVPLEMSSSGISELQETESSASAALFKTCIYQVRGLFGYRKLYTAQSTACLVACVDAHRKCLDDQGPPGVISCTKLSCD